MIRTRVVRIAVACAVLAAASVIVAGSSSADSPPWGDFTATALAIPPVPGTNTDDAATRFERVHGHHAEIKGVATTSLTCDGCTGHARTLQVVYAGWAHAVTANNVATAWASQCTGCSGWAVSLQIVVARSVRDLTAGNRALALNVACTNCDVRAAAVQIVVASPRQHELTDRQTDDLYGMLDQLIAALNSTPATPNAAAPSRQAQVTPNQSRAAAAVTATAERVQATVASALQASSATHAVSVQG